MREQRHMYPDHHRQRHQSAEHHLPKQPDGECASQVPAPNTNGVITSDSCAGTVTVTWQGDTISSSNCLGQFTISRTYRAIDQCGNSATCTQTITVNDTNPPSITCRAT